MPCELHLWMGRSRRRASSMLYYHTMARPRCSHTKSTGLLQPLSLNIECLVLPRGKPPVSRDQLVLHVMPRGSRTLQFI